MKTCNLLNGLWRSLWVCVLAAMLSGLACANNIRIIGAPKVDKEGTTGIAAIKFDIAWDNSWKTPTPNNHDAAWIYVKCWDGEAWRHVYLEATGNIPGSTTLADAVNPGLVYQVSDIDGTNMQQPMVLEAGYSMGWKEWGDDPDEEAQQCIVGFFLYRQNYGSGHVVVPGVSLKWKYTDQTFTVDDDLTVKVFAVEMVYVPQGGYYLGGVGTAGYLTGSFTTYKANINNPMYIASEAAIPVTKATENTDELWACNSAMEIGEIPEAFPKGFNAFYIMKYELTQQAYVEFLNTLKQGQQNGRVQGDLNTLGENTYAYGSNTAGWRNGIMIKQAAPNVVFAMDGNENGIYDEIDTICEGEMVGDVCQGRMLQRNIDGQDWAVNLVCFWDLLAYAEFSGLRPMTELEYEKACRGPRLPAPNEFAWGNATLTFFHGKHRAILDEGTGTERPADYYNAGGWVRQGTVTKKDDGTTIRNGYASGPLRVGCFADSTTNRTAAGASYWGVMNLSDNVSEMCANASWNIGRQFVGTHGSGILTETGDAINGDWMGDGTWKVCINRGMDFDNDGNGYPAGGPISDGDLNAGMVSNRKLYGTAIALTYRTNTGWMRGIRCVRTAGAAR